jgi:hypothetical protein
MEIRDSQIVGEEAACQLSLKSTTYLLRPHNL